jgi:hypothetical protein
MNLRGFSVIYENVSDCDVYELTCCAHYLENVNGKNVKIANVARG